VLVTVTPHGGATLNKWGDLPYWSQAEGARAPNTLILACKKILNLVLNLAIYPVLGNYGK